MVTKKTDRKIVRFEESGPIEPPEETAPWLSIDALLGELQDLLHEVTGQGMADCLRGAELRVIGDRVEIEIHWPVDSDAGTRLFVPLAALLLSPVDPDAWENITQCKGDFSSDDSTIEEAIERAAVAAATYRACADQLDAEIAKAREELASGATLR